MTDFADAFRRGQDAAAIAAAARAEISGVFDEANTQLQTATDGKIEIDRRRFEKPRKKTLGDLFGGLNATSLLANLDPAETEPWVAARNPKATDSSWIKLAKWDRPQEGYPCQLVYDRTDVRCHDRAALVDAIEEMLANASIGEKMRDLLELPLKDAG